MTSYDDIIHIKAPIPLRHARMPVEDRAAQFAPFAALTGYEAAVAEAGRRTERAIELDENEMALLDRKLRFLREQSHPGPTVKLRYFMPDLRKEGGAYRETEAQILRFEQFPPGLWLSTGEFVALEYLTELEILAETEGLF